MTFSLDRVRADFPLLARQIGGNALTYLDGAATAQLPLPVLEAMEHFLKTHRGNVHRGMHVLAEEATEQFEGARDRVRSFLNAKHSDEIIFTKSTTESINLVARCLDTYFGKDDAIALSVLEHHSNIVPWQQLAARTGARIVWIDITENGQLDDASVNAALLTKNLKLLAVTGMSNVLGVRPDIQALIKEAHNVGAWTLVDAAQLVAHDAIDVQALDADFLAFSGHKLYGPTGIGALYGKRDVLKKLPPFLGGGNMIEQVTKDGFIPADAPAKFEAGTPPVTEAIGLAAAIDWIAQFPLSERRAHEKALFAHVRSLLETVDGLRILGPAEAEGLLSFVVDGVHPHDLTSLLGAKGICLRAGHHCTQPLHARLGIEASTRLSLSLHTTTEELDRLPDALRAAIDTLR